MNVKLYGYNLKNKQLEMLQRRAGKKEKAENGCVQLDNYLLSAKQTD